MALVKDLVKDDREPKGVHPTQVDCRYRIFERDGTKFVQLNTYGSTEREIPDKLSQTLQFDKQAAESLWRMLGREFGFK
jgi:hypothetical protein